MNSNSQNARSSFGFTTASGSSINVSSKALSKARAFFNEELIEIDNYENPCDNQENESSKFKEQLPDVAFQTAKGQNIETSEEAVLKARTLFKNETDELVGELPDIGFQTASGKSIQITERAVSKAMALFEDDANDFKEELPSIGLQTSLGKNVKITQKPKSKAMTLFKGDVNDFKGILPTIGFQTASGKNVEITEKAVCKAMMLFKDDADEFKAESSNIGFQTASGKNVPITEKAISKAMMLFKDDTDELKEELSSIGFQKASWKNVQISKEALSTEVTLFKDDTDDSKTSLSDVGFQTANGRNVTITEGALSKAMALFKDDTNEFTEALPNIGFHTVSGRNVKVTEQAMSKAVSLFENNAHEFEIELPNIGLQITSNETIKETKEALTKKKTLLQVKDLQPSEYNAGLIKSFQKRKINDLDDNPSTSRQTKSNQFKKLRFSSEFKIPKTMQNNTIDIKGKENQATIVTNILTSTCVNDKLDDNTNNIEGNTKNIDAIDNSLISHEIVASTVALLADEKDSNFSELCLSPSKSKKNDETTTVPSSPVIGGQFIRRKRKSTGGRRKGFSTKNTENKLVHTDQSNETNVQTAYRDISIKEINNQLIEKRELSEDSKKSDTFITNEYGDTQLMLEFINQSAIILEKRLQATVEQDKQISSKQGRRIKPTISKLYFHRKSNAKNRVSWNIISKGNNPVPCTYEELIERKLPPDILYITANNAMAYKFRCADFYGQAIVQNNIDGINMEDGASLILDENDYAGIVEIKRSFLASPGVDPNLLFHGWVENHYKWIVWKLASMDRIKLGSVFLARSLSPSRVMMELKYRYDREIDRADRSALRKILEKDDVPSKRMVLCVASITEYADCTTTSGSPTALKAPSKKLVLTDGWYSVQASIDQAMIKNITSGKVREGTKLLTYGAELLNCDQGCPPLEVPENVCLKLHTNSTRRARWDLKLGYVAPPLPICIKLRSVSLSGGLVGKIKASVARVYPLLYHEKTLSGESIFRNARCEEKANIVYEKECRSMIEAFYAKAEKYFHGWKRKSDSNTDSIDLVAHEWNEDCEKLSKEEFFSEQELQELKKSCREKEEKFRQKLESRLQQSLPPPRQVTSVLKVRIIDEDTSAILSIWSPSEEIIDILKEGNSLSICNVMPSIRRGNELQLSASRSTVFHRLSVPNMNYPRRTYTALCDINTSTFAPAYGEFDTVGLVTCIRNEPYGMKNFEAIYLAHPHADSQSSLLSVLFWQGISSHGYAEILTVGSFIACCNLEWRRATSWNIPIAYSTERSLFTRNPRQNHLQQPFVDLKHAIIDVNGYIDACKIEISEEIQKRTTTRTSDQYVPDKSNIDKVPINENANTDRQSNNYASEILPGSSLMNNQPAKSAAIQKRLQKLQYYGEPPSLSPIVLKNSSKRVSLEFQSPLKSRNEKRKRFNT